MNESGSAASAGNTSLTMTLHTQEIETLREKHAQELDSLMEIHQKDMQQMQKKLQRKMQEVQDSIPVSRYVICMRRPAVPVGLPSIPMCKLSSLVSRFFVPIIRLVSILCICIIKVCAHVHCAHLCLMEDIVV